MSVLISVILMEHFPLNCVLYVYTQRLVKTKVEKYSASSHLTFQHLAT